MQKSVQIFLWSFLLQSLIIIASASNNVLMVKVLPSELNLHTINVPQNMTCLLSEEELLDPRMNFNALIMDLEIRKYLPMDLLLKGRIFKSYFLLLKDSDGYQVHALLKYHLSNTINLMIDELAVSQKYRRQGLARLLLLAIENIAILQKIEEIWVIVNRDNVSAIKLYASMGYIQE